MKILQSLLGRPLEVYVAHAARARKNVDLSAQSPVSLFTTIRTSNGVYLEPDDYFMVIAEGSSLAGRGIKNGARLLARRINPDMLPKVSKGATVVVNAMADWSNTGRRLRVFRGLNQGKVEFENDAEGHSHRARLANEVVGVITHVVP